MDNHVQTPERLIVQAGKVTKVFVPGINWLFFEGQQPFNGEYVLASSRMLPPGMVERLRAAENQYRPIKNGEHRETFWLLRDILSIVDPEQ